MSSLQYDKRIGIVGAKLAHLQRIEAYGVGRVELVMVPDDDFQSVRQHINRTAHYVAIHSPLRRNCGIPEYPLLTSVFDTDPDRRRRSLQLMKRNIGYAVDWGAQYIVLHLQRPILVLGEEVPADWDEDRAINATTEAINQLLPEARAAELPIYLENMIANPLFAHPQTYVRLLEKFPPEYVGLCFDIGHAALDCLNFGFDLMEFTETLAPYVGSMHIHNNRITDDIEFANLRDSGLQNKYPIHPSQSADDGWIDVEGIIDRIMTHSPDALPTLEVYYSLDKSRARFREGLDWLTEICERHRR